MLDKDAIQHIQTTANIPNLLEQVKDTKTPIAIVPDQFSIEDLEKYMPYRSNYRLHFITSLPTDFVEYAQEYDNENAKCFINPESMNAHVIFDLGNEDKPEHQRHSATLSLKKTEAYKALLCANNKRFSQKEAADFIEDWAENLVILSTNKTDMKPALAAAKLRDLTIEAARSINTKVSDFGESTSGFDKVEAKDSDSLPSTLTFSCIPYQGLTEHQFELRLALITSEDKPKVSMRVIKLESKQEELANEFKALLAEKFSGNKLKTFIGNV